MKYIIHISIVLWLCLLTSCSLRTPVVKMASIEQGVPVEASRLSQVQIGTMQSEVIELLGSPVTRHPFKSPQWIYLEESTSENTDKTTAAIVIEFDEQQSVKAIGKTTL